MNRRTSNDALRALHYLQERPNQRVCDGKESRPTAYSAQKLVNRGLAVRVKSNRTKRLTCTYRLTKEGRASNE